MNRQVNSSFATRQSQRGVAILAITIILLIVATIATLMLGRVSQSEQKVVGTDVRSKEVYSAALGGLDYGINWFRQNFSTLVWAGGDGCGRGATATPTALANTVLNADTYAHTLSYRLKSCMDPEDGMPAIVELTSSATATGDSHVTKQVTTEVMLGTVNLFSPTSDAGGDGTFTGPPIMIEGCTTAGAVTGSPNIIYSYGTGVAIGTTSGVSNDVTLDECIAPADINVHLDLCDIVTNPNSCANADAISAGEALAAGVEFRDNLEPSTSLWKSVFGDITRADLNELERREPSRIYVVDSTYPHYNGQPSWNGNTWHHNSGTLANPVIIYFDESVGCPPVNGSTTVYGLIYYAKVDCGNQGWGGGTVYGTVAKAGDLQKFNANATVINTSLDFSQVPSGGGSTTTIDLDINEVSKFSEIPGSFRDF